MEMTERDCYEALGLTPPEETAAGAGEGSSGEHAAAHNAVEDGTSFAEARTPDEGEDGTSFDGTDASSDDETSAVFEDGQEEPAEVDTPETREGENEREPAGPADRTEPVQSKAERARQAAARRKREQDEAVAQARREERQAIDAELKELFGWAGFKNGSAPIESLDQFRSYKQQSDAAQLERDLKAGKLTPDMLRQMVQNEMQAMQPAPEPEPPETDPAFQAQVEAELAEIRKYDPSIQTIQDFRNLDRAEAFFSEIREHNHSFVEAYRIAYADKIAAASAKKAAAASAQRTLNNARSKDHMRPAGARGAGDVAVPADVLQHFRALGIKATNEEIRQYYQKFMKRSGK